MINKYRWLHSLSVRLSWVKPSVLAELKVFKCRLQLSQRSRGISVVSLSVRSGQHSDDPAGRVRRSERDTCQVQLQRKEDAAIIDNNDAESGAEQWEPTDSRELWITTAEPDTTNCSSFHTTELLLLDLTISDQNQGRKSGTHSYFIQNIIATFLVLFELNRTTNKAWSEEPNCSLSVALRSSGPDCHVTFILSVMWSGCFMGQEEIQHIFRASHPQRTEESLSLSIRHELHHLGGFSDVSSHKLSVFVYWDHEGDCCWGRVRWCWWSLVKYQVIISDGFLI